jgi:hypothetical protein
MAVVVDSGEMGDRCATGNALAYLGEKEVVPLLLRLLKDKDGYGGTAAAGAPGELGIKDASFLIREPMKSSCADYRFPRLRGMGREV